MIDPHALVAARRFGALRYSVLSERTHDMTQVLRRFGLRPEPLLLFEHSREAATAILFELLGKDLVGHEIVWMSKPEASTLSAAIISEHSCEESRYFSNRESPELLGGFTPFTESTFDSGLIITGRHCAYFCIWFEDED